MTEEQKAETTSSTPSQPSEPKQETKKEGMFMPSQKELDKQNEESMGAPLPADDYIVKVAKIALKKVPTFFNKVPNWNHLTLGWKLVCLVHSTKSGDVLKDTTGKEAKPLSRWIYRDIDPFKIQSYQGTPSFLRAFLGYMQGITDVTNDRIPFPDIVVVDKDLVTVTDEAKREKMKKELTDSAEPKDMHKAGYMHLADVTSFEGNYIGCSVEIDKNERNRISKFSKLPDSFEAPTPEVEQEAMAKFEEGYAKMIKKVADRDAERIAGIGGQSQGGVVNEEVPISDELPIADMKF